jgi:hypothetical protein
VLKAAVWYASHGYAVMPLHSVEAGGACSCGRAECENVGKHPRTTHGLSDATTELEKVRAFWSRWPNANVGIATGPSGLVVVDVDPKNGGDESFGALRTELGAATFDTVTALTGGGGEHYYFRDEFAQFRNSAGLIAPGIDVRAVGGYVVAPPSVHVSGRKYEWEASSRIDDHPIATLPASIAEKLRKPKATSSGDFGNVVDLKIKQGGRDNALARAAGAMRYKGFDEEEIFATLSVTNRKRCEPPLPEADVRRIAKSIARYEPTAPIDHLTSGNTALAPAADVVLVPQQAGFAVMRSWLEPHDSRRYDVGLPGLDEVLKGLRPGEMTVLGAWTGVGKSGLSEQAALHISQFAKTLFLPLELGVERTERRMLAKIMQSSEEMVEFLERSTIREHKLQIHDAIERLQDRKLSMLAPTGIEVYRYAHIERLIREQKPDIVFIDHLKHIEDWTPSGTQRSDLNAAAIVRRLRALADETKVHVFCVHQLKTPPGGAMKRTTRPGLYDFSDTSALSQVADTVLMLHRPFRGMKHKDKIMEILVLKNRRGAEPWIHTHFEGSHIGLYHMDAMEALMAECCAVKTPVAHG